MATCPGTEHPISGCAARNRSSAASGKKCSDSDSSEPVAAAASKAASGHGVSGSRWAASAATKGDRPSRGTVIEKAREVLKVVV